MQPDIRNRVQPVFVEVGEISRTHEASTILDGSVVEAANQYTIEELESDIEEWIAANGERYAALAR